MSEFYKVKELGFLSPTLAISEDYIQVLSNYWAPRGTSPTFISKEEFIDLIPKPTGHGIFYESSSGRYLDCKDGSGHLMSLRDEAIFISEDYYNSPEWSPSGKDKFLSRYDEMIKDFMYPEDYCKNDIALRYGRRKLILCSDGHLDYTSGVIPKFMKSKDATESDTLKLFNRLEKKYLNLSKVEKITKLDSQFSIKVKGSNIVLKLIPYSFPNKEYMQIYTFSDPRMKDWKPWIGDFNIVRDRFYALKLYYLNRSL